MVLTVEEVLYDCTLLPQDVHLPVTTRHSELQVRWSSPTPPRTPGSHALAVGLVPGGVSEGQSRGPLPTPPDVPPRHRVPDTATHGPCRQSGVEVDEGRRPPYLYPGEDSGPERVPTVDLPLRGTGVRRGHWTTGVPPRTDSPSVASRDLLDS